MIHFMPSNKASGLRAAAGTCPPAPFASTCQGGGGGRLLMV